MKNSNLLNRLLSYSHEKQSPQRFARYAVMLIMLLTLGVGQMWGAWTGNAGICVNGTWYKASDHIDGGNWLNDKSTINGTNLGVITSLELGGEYQNYDDSKEDACNWNSNNGIWITITTNSGTSVDAFKLSCYRDGKSGNNNVWKTTGSTGTCGDGSSWDAYSVDISGYAAGVYKLKVHWFSASGVALPSSGDDVATFTINPVVTFKANGGTGSDYTQTVTYNSATALTANTFSRTGYTFLGWATAADGDVVYADGANVTLTAHTDLYAKWGQQSLTITSHPDYLTTTSKLNLSIEYANIPSGYCYRVKELRTGGYYNSEAHGTYDPISGTGSTTYTSSAYLPLGADRIVLELWNGTPGVQQTVVSNEVAVTVEQGWEVGVQAKTDGVISTAGGTVSPASVSPTAHIGRTITAEAEVGYDFTGWTANTVNITFANPSALSTTVYATSGGAIYANFAKQSSSYTTTFYAGDHGSINAKGTAIAKKGSASVTIGENETLSATPESAEYVFDHWGTTGSVSVASATSATTTVTATAAGGTVTAYYRHIPVLGAVTATPSGQQNYAGSPIDFALSVTSTYLAHPVVVFLVNDGTTTYEVVGAPYGADGSSAAGTIGSDAANTTVHKATFTASEAKTYTVSAKLYEGELIDNFEGENTRGWAGDHLGSGSMTFANNPDKMTVNGSNKVMQVTRIGGENWGGAIMSFTAVGDRATCDAAGSNDYAYIHARMKDATDATRLKNNDAAGNTDDINPTFDGATSSDWRHVTYHNTHCSNNFLFFMIQRGNADDKTVYIDDIILSNEETMTVKASQAATASFSINWNYTVTLNNNGATSAGTESVNVTYGSATGITDITVPTKTGYTFGGYYTADAGAGTLQINASGVWQNAAYVADGKWNSGSNQTLYAKWTENMRNVTISAGTGGTVDKTSASVGVATTTTVTATAQPGYRFTEWTATNCSVASTSSASTTLSGNGATGAATLVANFARTYAYIEGRMTVYNAARSTETHVGSSKGKWSESSFNIAMDYDATNHRFYRHTYKTPAELSATQTDGTAQSQWFSIARSNASGSWSGKTTYHPSDNNIDLTTTGIGQKKAAQTSTKTYNYKFNSSTSDGYAIIYFDEAGVWYELEHTLEYSGNGGSGSAPASKTYYNHGVNATAASNSYSKTGYTFDGWKTGASSGTAYAVGADVPMNSNITLYAQWAINNHAITHSASSHGTYTIKVGSAAAVSTNTTADYNQTVVLAATPATGYHFTGWTVTKKGGGSVTVTSNQFSMPDDDVTVSATFAANTYSVTFDANGGTGDAMSAQAFTYDVAQALSANTYTRTGYDFDGWATAADGAKVYDPAQSVSNLTAANGGTFPLFAHWTPNNYTVTLDIDEANHGTIDGKATSASVTFDAAPTAIAAGQLPTAAQGYAFMGFFTAAGGEGVQVINANGTWIASVTGYTDGSGHWILADDATLYAYYKKAEITGIALSSGTVLPEGSVTATATIEPTPTPTTIICWKLLYNNGTEYSPQPTFTPVSGSEVSFNAPEASGTYKVQAQLRTGSVCGGGTLLSENETSFIVAGTHNVTIQYKCGDVIVKSSTVVEGVKPLEWSEAITPGDAPFGYRFDHWEAGDGVTISTDGTSAIGGTTTTTSTIYIQAIYDGRLTAHYAANDYIYFKNTMGWSGVYVYFYSSDKYWDDITYGSGTDKNKPFKNGEDNNHKPYWDQKHGIMTQIEGTDVWYFDAGAIGCADWSNVVFNANQQDNYEWFSATEVVRRGDFNKGTPMFVPADKSSYSPVTKNTNANYYNQGYWVKYLGENTGYTLEVYNSDGSSLLKSIPLLSADKLMPMTATVDLEAEPNYKFRIKRDNNLYYGNSGTMNYANHGQTTPWSFANNDNKCGLTTTAAGDYIFRLSYSKGDGDYNLRMSVDYPIANGDYRVIYKDNVHTAFKPSAIVTQAANHKDTVSFFIRPGSSPVMKIQQSSVTNEGAITWNDLSDISSELTAVRCPKDSVYNICLTMNESGVISVENVEGYTGSFYIRTDAADNKWDNYRAADHEMTYSEYAEKKTGSDYTHYWMAHVYANANVKFVIANDYSPCISDTLIQQTVRGGDALHVNGSGDIQAEANIRYMWDMRNNAVMRAYLAPAQTDGSKFLVLQGQDTKLLAPNGDALTGDSEANPGNNHGGGANAIQFTDKENWMYDAEVQAVPGGRVKLYAVFHGSTFYYYGDNNASFDDPHAIDLIGGSGDAQNIRVVYDFKTDRLIAAWVPSDGDIDVSQTINADIMLIREHQNAGKQINLKGTGSISTNKTVYGVMRFNRWTLNNKSTINTGTVENPVHAVLPVGEQKSQYERFNYMISFPFDVKVGEIFGFGTIGRHYRIYYYDGLGRAKEGFFAERGDDNWRMIDDTDSILHANQGYLLQLNYIRMADDNTATWPQKNMNEVELYFPAMNEINTIQLENVEIPALGDAYKCKINLQPTYHALNNPDSAEADRRIKDSYWRCIGVPGFTSYEANAGTWENFNWKAETDSLPYLYEWQMDDNKLSVVSSLTFTFKPMHAYLIQNGKSFTWTSVAHPTLAAAPRRSAAEEGFYEFYLELQNGEQALDHTYVRLTDKENITADFDFGQDLSKELNSGANIFTKVGYERLAANNLPLSEQTTIVPVGVKIAEEGNYTFAMPEGTHGVGVTLVDNETGDRTNLSLFDYSVNLTKGDYDNRFLLEISPIVQSPTGIELLNGENGENGVRKVLIDNILYIVKDGIVYDAQGHRVQ